MKVLEDRNTKQALTLKYAKGHGWGNMEKEKASKLISLKDSHIFQCYVEELDVVEDHLLCSFSRPHKVLVSL